MEIEILPTTKFADKKIIDLDMPDGVVIGGIVRNKKLIFPDENTTIYVNDKLIICQRILYFLWFLSSWCATETFEQGSKHGSGESS